MKFDNFEILEVTQMEVAEKIRVFLQKHGIETACLSQKTGIAVQKLELILVGKRRLNFEDYAAICRALHLDISAFLEPCAPPRRAAGRRVG